MPPVQHCESVYLIVTAMDFGCDACHLLKGYCLDWDSVHTHDPFDQVILMQSQTSGILNRCTN